MSEDSGAFIGCFLKVLAFLAMLGVVSFIVSVLVLGAWSIATK